MTKFFKPKDFSLHVDYTAKELADKANAKLEREGKVVYGIIDTDAWTTEKTKYKSTHLEHKALLIAIEPIEKCKHPAEKVKEYGLHVAKEFIEKNHSVLQDDDFALGYGFEYGAIEGYNLALKHASVLREALGYMVMRMTDVKMESQWLDEAREALEQFDKITGE